jgi:hypothetical protein
MAVWNIQSITPDTFLLDYCISCLLLLSFASNAGLNCAFKVRDLGDWLSTKMSGVEAITLVQLVDACIGITHAIITIAQAARNDNGLPKKLAKLFEELPAVYDIFEKAKQRNGTIEDETHRSAKPVLKQCKEDLEALKALFEKICPLDGSSRFKRVWSGAKAEVIGRNTKLLSLWEAIQGHLEILEKKEIFEIGDTLDGFKKAMESLAEEEGSRYTNNGTGPQIINEGEGNQYIQGGGTGNTFAQNFGST